MSPQARFDMRDGRSGGESCQRRAERTRCIALDDKEIGCLRQHRQQRSAHRADVAMRIFFAGAVQRRGLQPGEPEFIGIKVRMLSGQDELESTASRRERPRDGGELDGFGPRADNQPDFLRTQPSP